MEKSKLIDLLRSLDQNELRRFRDFVASPYFNKNVELIPFINYLVDLSPDFMTSDLSKELVFKAVFPEEEYDKKKLAYQMNYLLKLGETFLAVEKYQEDELLMNYHTLSQFTYRQLDKHYNYLYKKSDQLLNEQPLKREEDFYNSYLLSKASTDHFTSKRLRQFDPSLQLSADKLDSFYFFNKLKYSCEMLNRQSIIAADYQLKFLAEVRDYLLQQSDIDPLIEIYLMIYLSTALPDEEQHFEQLIALIEQHTDSIDATMMRDIYLNAINYCARKIRAGKSIYLAKMLNLYTLGIENRALYDGDYLTQWTYTNVVKLALRLKRYEFGEDFIKTYAERLPPPLREDAKHFNLAELYFHKKDYEEVLTHLNQLHFTDLHYHLGSRTILLKTYYEQGQEEPLISLLASFSVFLRRNKTISPTAKQTCLNFCNLLNQILRRNPSKKDKIIKDIKTTQPLAERGWLMNVWEREY